MAEVDRLNGARFATVDGSDEPILALPAEYPAGFRVKVHRHNRAQLLYARTGVVMVSATKGRWMVPPDHALWIPAGMDHSVEMLGSVSVISVYVRPGAVGVLPEEVRVVGLTDLARSLIVEAISPAPGELPDARAALIRALLIEEIPYLPECPFGLPFPADPRLAELCRGFLAAPSPRLTIDEWADALAMSRRAFTRAFRRETGVGLSTWRQQACLFTAVPRLAGGEPVTSVALDLGYDSVAAFTTMFRRMLGTAPRRYLATRRSQEQASKRK